MTLILWVLGAACFLSLVFSSLAIYAVIKMSRYIDYLEDIIEEKQNGISL